MKIKIIFRWLDFWVGLFFDSAKGWLYFLPLPTLGIVIKFLPDHYFIEKIKTHWDEEYPITAYKAMSKRIHPEGDDFQIGTYKTWMQAYKACLENEKVRIHTDKWLKKQNIL